MFGGLIVPRKRYFLSISNVGSVWKLSQFKLNAEEEYLRHGYRYLCFAELIKLQKAIPNKRPLKHCAQQVLDNVRYEKNCLKRTVSFEHTDMHTHTHVQNENLLSANCERSRKPKSNYSCLYFLPSERCLKESILSTM